MVVGLLGRRGVYVHYHVMEERKRGIGTVLTQHLLVWGGHASVIVTKSPYATATHVQVEINYMYMYTNFPDT